MARPKKNGTKFSCYMDTEIYRRLHRYTDAHGMSVVGATELALKSWLDLMDAREEQLKKLQEQGLE